MIHLKEVGRFQQLMVKSRTFQPGERSSLGMSQWRASRAFCKEERNLHLPEKEASEIDETDEKKGKLAHLAVNRNKLAMVSFSIAFTTKKAMNMMYTTCTENRSDGEAHLVVRETNIPLDNFSKEEMCQHLSRKKIKRGMNPSESFETLTSKQNQLFGSGRRHQRQNHCYYP
jgi:hypothetical protein